MLKVPITTVAMMTIKGIFRALSLRGKHFAPCRFENFRRNGIGLPQVMDGMNQCSIRPIHALHGSPSFVYAVWVVWIWGGRRAPHLRPVREPSAVSSRCTPYRSDHPCPLLSCGRRGDKPIVYKYGSGFVGMSVPRRDRTGAQIGDRTSGDTCGLPSPYQLPEPLAVDASCGQPRIGQPLAADGFDNLLGRILVRGLLA